MTTEETGEARRGSGHLGCGGVENVGKKCLSLSKIRALLAREESLQNQQFNREFPTKLLIFGE